MVKTYQAGLGIFGFLFDFSVMRKNESRTGIKNSAWCVVRNNVKALPSF